MMRAFNFRLDEQTHTDILAMARHVGKTGNLTAGLCAIIAEWRRLVAERDDRLDLAAIQARHEAYLDARERGAEAEGCGY